MKIAVASMGNVVAGHFGHCENFNIFDIENGVNVIIAGGMGEGAVNIFNARNIEVIMGATGVAQEAVERYLRGELKSTGSICHEHQHEGECGGHHHA